MQNTHIEKNWRHANVLRFIAGALLEEVRRFNRGEHIQRQLKEWAKFKFRFKLTQYENEDKYPVHFPRNIYNTAERPNDVVWSDSLVK